jgi:hypothetical protein
MLTKKYKDFDKYDPRRYLVALFALERLKERATAHYMSLEIGCTRAEASRAIDSAKKLYLVEVDKKGSVYTIVSWGVLNRKAALRAVVV